MTCFFAPNPALAPVLVFSHITSRVARTLPGQGLVGCCAIESCGCEVWSVKCEYYEMVWWHWTGRTPCLYVNISWPESERRVGGQPGPAAAQWANWLGGGNRETSPASQADTTTRETLQVRPEGHTSYSVNTPERTDTIQDTQTHHSQDHMPASSPLSPVQPPTLPPTTQSQLTVPTLPLYRLQIFTDPSSNLSAVLHLRGLFLSHLQSISALFLCEILTVQWEL